MMLSCASDRGRTPTTVVIRGGRRAGASCGLLQTKIYTTFTIGASDALKHYIDDKERDRVRDRTIVATNSVIK